MGREGGKKEGRKPKRERKTEKNRRKRKKKRKKGGKEAIEEGRKEGGKGKEGKRKRRSWGEGKKRSVLIEVRKGTRALPQPPSLALISTLGSCSITLSVSSCPVWSIIPSNIPLRPV